MSARTWRIFVAPACVSVCIGLAAQQQPSTPNETPKFVQEPCDPPVPHVSFSEKSDPNLSKRVRQLFDDDQARESSARNGKDWRRLRPKIVRASEK